MPVARGSPEAIVPDPRLLDPRVQPLLPPLPELPLLRGVPRAHALVDGEPAARPSSLVRAGRFPGGRSTDPSLVAAPASVPPRGAVRPCPRKAAGALRDRGAAPGSGRAARAARADGGCVRPSIAVRGARQ